MPHPPSTLEELTPILLDYGQGNFHLKRLEVIGAITSRPLEPEEPLEIIVTLSLHHHFSVTYFRIFRDLKEQLEKRLGRPVSVQDRRYLHSELEDANRNARTIFLQTKRGKSPALKPERSAETNSLEANAEQARRLLEMLVYSRKAVGLLAGLEPTDLIRDDRRQLALERCFSVIGEASRHTKAEASYSIATLLLEKLRGLQHRLTEPSPSKRAEMLVRFTRQELPSVIGQIEAHESVLSQAILLKNSAP